MSPSRPAFLQPIIGPRSLDPDVARREVILNVLLVSLLALGAAFIGAKLVAAGLSDNPASGWQNQATSFAGAGIGMLVCLIAYGLSWRGHLRAAAYLIVVALLLSTVWLTWRWGIEIVDVALFFVAIVLAGTILEGIASLLAAGAAFVLYTGVGVLQGMGLHPIPLRWPLLPNIASFGIVLFVVAILVWISNRQLKKTLHESEQQTANLLASRQEEAKVVADLQAETEEQARLLRTAKEPSPPVVAIHNQLIALPLVSHLDDRRADRMRQALMEGIVHHRARFVLIDISGLPEIDSKSVHHLEDMCQASRLLGAETALVGIHAEVASEMVKTGIDLQSLRAERDLQSGIEWALANMGQRIVSDG